MDREPAKVPIRRALISVSDKTDLISFVKGLAAFGVEIISTGGTRRELDTAGISVLDVSDVTGFPEMLDGRVKTLHPAVHGGLLHRRDVPEHLAQITAHGISPIDLLVVNLYPFEKVSADPKSSLDEVIENIDIGGPAMIRSAAKNHSHVAVLVDPSQYRPFLAELQRHRGAIASDFLRDLAFAAFERTAEYDRRIADTLQKRTRGETLFPPAITLSYRKGEELRYGENPHQQAAFYLDSSADGPSILHAKKLHGKELSYNNLLDLDAALSIVLEFDRPAVSVIKHNNPCGSAVADQLVAAFRAAWDGDPTSAFGSVLGINRTVDAETAGALIEPGRFVEAIVAPDFDAEAIRLLTTVPTWKANVRLLAFGPLPSRDSSPSLEYRPIAGGLLVQTRYTRHDDLSAAKVVTALSPTESQRRDLAFAWALVRHVRSNAIVLAASESAVGVGAGQMSRVDACRIAIEKAGERARGAVLASDAFFPFRDNVDLAAKAGITAIVQPGGSKRDTESIEACNEHGIAMLFTGERRFKH
jgi:phosphoribosylaminoimidazolecarboxamide formyltransferase / IMP cyclohydrolase